MTDKFEFGAHQATARRILACIERKQHVLLTGLTGAGKTHLANSIIENRSAPGDAYLCAPQLITAETGGPERRLAKLLLDEEGDLSRSHSCSSSPTSIIVIDMVETMAGHLPDDSVLSYEVEHRLASVFRHCLDHTSKVVIAITNRPEAIDEEFRRAGRLFHSINVSLSKGEQREILLREVLPKGMLLEEEVRHIAHRLTHGYSAADLHHLVAMSLMHRLQMGTTEAGTLKMNDFEKAVANIRPSIASDLPLINKSIPVEGELPLVGLSELQSRIMHLILDPLEKVSLYTQYRITPTRGVLLHGPSGSGKTALALRCAQASGLTVIHVQATAIISKYVGQSEKNLVEYFRRARQCAPSILFLDHLEALFPQRSGGDPNNSGSSGSQGGSQRLITCLLTELDGLRSRQSGDGVFILAATAYPESIDVAVLRPGRIGVNFAMPSFNADMRRSFLEETPVPLKLTIEQMEELTQFTEGFSAADMDSLLREAALMTIRERGDAALELSHVPYEYIVKGLGLDNRQTISS